MKYYDLETPALLVDIHKLQANINQMASLVRTYKKRLRPHAKTHKTPEIAKMQLDSGAIGLTVAKLGEAEVFVEAGCRDIFIANQLVGEKKLERLMGLCREASIQVGVDSAEVAMPLSHFAQKAGVTIGVRLEIDTGLKRAGVRNKQEAVDLALYLSKLPKLKFEGVFTYEGHIYQFKTDSERIEAVRKMADTLQELRDSLNRCGVTVPIVSVGSTPGARFTAPIPGLDELRCGVYVFQDRMQVARGAAPESCALTVLATIISVRSDGRIIVDAGTKALASDKPFADQSMGEVLEDPSLQFVAASEEHGHLQGTGIVRWRVGDKVRIIPNHACTCVNMHDQMYILDGEDVVEVWQIAARGKMQ